MPTTQPRPFVLIPGAGGAAFYWHRVAALLRAGGREADAVDLPGDDDSAGLARYAALVDRAIAGRADAILVAQSLGGFTAALVAARRPIGHLVLVNAMIPEPGETPGQWWANTGSDAARTAAATLHGYGEDFDLGTYFLHDVPPHITAEMNDHARDESPAVFESACAFDAWPDVPITVMAGVEDRFFPIAFQRRVARKRLNRGIVALPGGHLIALSQPGPLAAALLAL